MDEVLQNLRFAARSMTRRPLQTLLAAGTLALGIAASTAMFSVVDAVMLRPLPFPEPERVVSVYLTNPELAGHPTLGVAADRGWFSYPEFRALRDVEGVLDGLAPLATGGAVLYDDGEPERVPMGLTNAELFTRVLRVPPLFGRVFNDEDEAARANVVVLTEGFWRRRFGADAEVVGRTVRLGDTPFEIIGVVAQEARLAGYDVDMWRVIGADDNWGNHWLTAIGRLAPGVTREQAMPRLTAGFRAAAPPDHAGHGVNLFARQDDETRTVRGALLLLVGGALLLLAVACANVTALLVGAAIDREQELAVRAVLGAERGRIIRQLLTESTVLSLTAAAVGVLLAAAATRALVLLAPAELPRVAEATVDVRALGFAVGVSLLCGIIAGMLPALGFSRTDLRRSASLTTRGTTAARGRLQAAVVVGELALATMLLVGAGLLTRTVLALNTVDPGFAANETLGVRISVPLSRLVAEDADDGARLAAADEFYRSVAEQLAEIDGVRDVALTSVLPLSPDRSNNAVAGEGVEERPVAERRFVTPNFFDVAGIRFVEGRAFTAADDVQDAPGTVVISHGLARALWPRESALGKRLTYWGDRETRVVGVVEDIRDEELSSSTTLAFYVPRRQAGQLGGTFLLRTDGDPVRVIPQVRERVRRVHDAIAIIAAQPMRELIAEQTAAQRYRARLIFVFAALAALFSMMGVYGVTARRVARRTREMGIRMALGAEARDVLAMVVRSAAGLALLGAILGIVGALAGTRLIASYLYGVAPTDPVTIFAVAALLLLAGTAAALGPALRAASVDPADALRSD
jgi:putative ABC transport system permease protein